MKIPETYTWKMISDSYYWTEYW